MHNYSTTYAYDGFDRLATATFPDGTTEAYTYDGDSNPLTRKTRKGDTITLSYDTLNRLSSKAAPGEAAVTYAYDLAGHLTGVSDTSASIQAASTAASYAVGYSYDALNRLIAANWPNVPSQVTPSAASVAFAHGYDATNRRISQAVSDNGWLLYPAGAGSTGYTANALNQYSAVGSVSPSYDGNGNLTFDGSFSYGYDAESRLQSVAQGGSTVASYAYDAQGRRKTKTVGGSTTVYVTDADNREVLEYDGGSGQVQRWYAYALGPDEVLNQMNVAAGTRESFIPDIQGSILATLDSGSGALSRAGYLPYGENAGATTGTFRFTGRRLDAETAGSAAQPSGLYYYRARSYSPALGRFMQPDPVGYGGGGNLYAYVGNDPLNLLDPLGLQSIGVPVDVSRYRSPEGYLAQQAGASSIQAYQNGQDLRTALGKIAPSSADLYSAASGLSLVAGQPELAIAFGAGAAAQKSLDQLSNPTPGSAAKIALEAGVDVATSVVPGIGGVVVNYAAGKAVDLAVDSFQASPGKTQKLK